MSKLKVVTIVGTRPEIIRLAMLIPKLDRYTDHVFVHTGQNSDPKLNQVFFQDLELRTPNYYLNVDTGSMGAIMGGTLLKAEEVFLRERPDAVVILGDTNSAIAAVVAERMHIPVYHLEAGNRSFDNNVPEELNRRMVDHVSSFNLAYNGYSYDNLIREGLAPRQIAKTGSPILEIFDAYRESIAKSDVLSRLGLRKSEYFLASIHRQENVDHSGRLDKILSELSKLAEHFAVPVVISTHPRTRKQVEKLKLSNYQGLQFHEPFGYLDYSSLQLNSKCVISDSGTIFEESSIMGFRSVCMRDSTERLEAFAVGSALMCPVEEGGLAEIVSIALSLEMPKTLPDGYATSNFSDVVLKFLLSTAKLHKKWLGIHPLDLR